MALPHRNVTDPPRLRKPGRREQVAARQHEAMVLRRAGAHYRQIAERLNVSAMTAVRDVRAALRLTVEQTRASAAEHRALELSRLDSLLLGCWRNATNGDPQSIICALRIGERRAKLLGLDAGGVTFAAERGGEDLSAMSPEVLRARMLAALDVMTRTAAPPGPPVIDVRALEPVGVPLPVPETGSRDALLAAYERELRERRNGGAH